MMEGGLMGAGMRAPTLDDAEVVQLLEKAHAIGPLLQYDCPGFLPNQRQQRMGGLVRHQGLNPKP